MGREGSVGEVQVGRNEEGGRQAHYLLVSGGLVDLDLDSYRGDTDLKPNATHISFGT